MVTTYVSDGTLQRNVMDEFDWDPEVETTEVGVEVDDGVITLTGSVDSYAKKYAAERAAQRVDGVKAVANDLLVHPAGLGERTDTDIAHAAVDALRWNASVPTEAIEVSVDHGVVTLRGAVTWNYQRAAAASAIRKLLGVRSVLNQVTLTQPTVLSADIHTSIESAFKRHALLDASKLTAHVSNGHVTLSGTVQSWAERADAVDAAWKVPGVTNVTDRLHIMAS